MTTQALPDRAPSADLCDDELMAMLNNGEAEAALTELQRRYGRRVENWVQTIVRDVQLAQEVSYETFAKVFLKSHLYRPGSNFQAWLFEVARNHALSKLRDRRRRPLPISNLAATHDRHEITDALQLIADHREHREAEENEFGAAFETAVAQLPDRYREVFERCVRRGVSYRAAAAELGVPTGTVAIRIMRARKRLFLELAPHFDRIRRPPACLN